MSQTFDASPKTFGDLLGVFEKRTVAVPQFQRSYSWGKQHIATFWDDIYDFLQQDKEKGEQYFLGPIVIQEEGDRIVLLDGQQRLATATILLSVLRDYADSLDTEAGRTLARDIQRDLIMKRDLLHYSLDLGETDELFFKSAIKQHRRSPA